MNTAVLGLRGPFLVLLTSGFGLHYLLSNLITLLSLGLARYAFSDCVIWRNTFRQPSQRSAPGDTPSAAATGHWYDIHGIVRIFSNVRLPELERFRVDRSLPVDLAVTCGTARSGKSAGNGRSSIRFAEMFGKTGFWLEIRPGRPLEVQVGRLLRRSPHVLYTNVVEPVLRWLLVQKGYALVHAACLAANEKALLVTAATDTGKTTTVLRALSNADAGLAFVSDDMTIISRDGSILTFPKPLTISRHTLAAVNGAAQLNTLQRLAPQVQSRVHSKSGRRGALALARGRLPMATVNTIAQMLIPPPKYDIEQLIPGVARSSGGRVHQLVCIELSERDEVKWTSDAEGIETLLRNGEDAYGFPPYPQIARYLYRSGNTDLRTVEQAIISNALRGCPAVTLRSRERDWWRALPALLDTAREAGTEKGREHGDAREGSAISDSGGPLASGRPGVAS
jgi:hypothetical protein